MYKKIIMALILLGALLGIVISMGVSAIGSIVNASELEWFGVVFVIFGVLTIVIGFLSIMNDSWFGTILASILCIFLVGGVCIISLFCGILALVLTLFSKQEFEKGYATVKITKEAKVLRLPKKRY